MRFFLPLMVLAILANSHSACSQIYVTVNGAGLQNGTSWANAYSGSQLRQVVAVSPPLPTQVWVAAGTYYPHPTSRDSTFKIATNLKLFGGFIGNETVYTQRDWVNNVTTLSGDLGIANDTSDNSYNVVTFDNGSMCGIDGFTVTGGNANDDVNPWHTYGGGVFNMSMGTVSSVSNPDLYNCRFVNNHGIYGGAVANYVGSGMALVDIRNCHFENNTAFFGGAVYSAGQPDVMWWVPGNNATTFIHGSTFINNSAIGPNRNGGAITIERGGGDVNIVSSHFEDNFADNSGGAICINNIGGLLDNFGNYHVQIDSCSFIHNGVESTAGSALFHNSMSSDSSTLTVKNCFFEDNYSQLVWSASTAIWLNHSGTYLTRNRFIGCRFINNQRGHGGDVILSKAGPNSAGTETGLDSLLISNSFFYNNFNGEDIAMDAQNDAKHVAIISNSTIYHDTTTGTFTNSVYNTATWYGMGNFPGTKSSLYMFNSIIYRKLASFWGNNPMEIRTQLFNAPSNALYTYTSNSVITNSLPWPAAYGIDGGGNNEDYPGFVDTANMDFHLVCNAFGVDHGSNALIHPDTLATDINGDNRIFNSTVDMGAYETTVTGITLIPAVAANGMTITFNHNYNGLADSVHWSFGDNGTSSVDGGTHTYAQPGTYTICLYIENTCGTADSCFSIGIFPASTASINADQNDLLLYPNPVKEELNIQGADGYKMLCIYNAIGQQVYHGTGNTNKIRTAALPGGVYMLELKGKDGRLLRGRFVKQ